MKKRLIVLCFSICFLVPSNAKEIVVIATGEWAPYTSEKMSGKGFFTEIVTAVFDEMGMEPEFQFVPWVRAELMVKSGTAFACMPYSISDERKKAFDFSDNVIDATTKLFVYKGGRVQQGFEWKSYADLKPYVIGCIPGYWHEKEFKDAGLNVDFTNSEAAIIKNLALNRVDIVPLEELVGWRLIRELYPNEVAKFRTMEKPLKETSLMLMVSRSYPHSARVLEQFNASLAKIKKSGVYSAILRKYNVRE